MNWRVTLNGTDITAYVSGVQTSFARGNICGECTVELADASIISGLVVPRVPKSPSIFVEADFGSGYVSRGLFFLEQIDRGSDLNSRTATLWGRSFSARLSEPWAVKISKQWDSETTVAAIMAEVANLCGVTISLDADYDICQYCYAVSDWYPAQIIQDLADKTGKQIVMPQLDGSIHIAPRRYPPYPLPTITLGPADVQVQGVERTAPTFANRVLVSGDGAVTGMSVTVRPLYSDDDCVSANGVDTVRLLAIALDRDGNPVAAGTIVSWSASGGTLLHSTSITGRAQISGEVQKATDFNTLELDLPAAVVLGVYAYADKAKRYNYYVGREGSVSGKTITFALSLNYFDQTMVIDYLVDGCATNEWTAGNAPGDVTVLASVAGAQGMGTIHQSNPTACASSITLAASPDDICYGAGPQATITARVIMFKGAGSGPITFAIKSGCGSLSSTRKTLSNHPVTEQLTTSIWGTVTQVKLSAMPVSGSIFIYTDADPATNLFASNDGQTVDLSVVLDAGTKVWAKYTGGGTAMVSWLPGDVPSGGESVTENVTVALDGTTRKVTLARTPVSIQNIYDPDSPITNYYASHTGKEVTLLGSLAEGKALVAEYTATRSVMPDCSATIEVRVEDGSEDGAAATITVTAKDCANVEDPDATSGEDDANDPDASTGFDESDDEEKPAPDPASCTEEQILLRATNMHAANWKTNAGASKCPPTCTCDQLCTAYRNAGLLAKAGWFYSGCVQSCNETREWACGTCALSGPSTLDPGAEGVWNDGAGNTGDVSGPLTLVSKSSAGYRLKMPSSGSGPFTIEVKYNETNKCSAQVNFPPCYLTGPATLAPGAEGRYVPSLGMTGATIAAPGMDVRQDATAFILKFQDGKCASTVIVNYGGQLCGMISVTNGVANNNAVVTGPSTMEPGTSDYFAHNLISFSNGSDISVSAPGMVLKQKAGSGFILEMPTGATGSKTVTVTGPCGQTASMSVTAFDVTTCTGYPTGCASGVGDIILCSDNVVRKIGAMYQDMPNVPAYTGCAWFWNGSGFFDHYVTPTHAQRHYGIVICTPS